MTGPLIIGLTGHAGAGKDSAALCLLASAWRSIAFADALRVEIAAAWRIDVRMLTERATFDDGTNGVEAGIADMLDRMQTGRWKVFRGCTNWVDEFRLYHRKDGKIVKERDDVLSASRYALMMKRHAIVKPKPRPARTHVGAGGWMG